MSGKGISGFVVEQLFSFRVAVRIAIGIVVSCRFFLGNGERGIDAMVGVDISVQSDFRVEEVELIFNMQGLKCVRIIVPFVIPAMHLVGDVTVLQIGVCTDTTT